MIYTTVVTRRMLALAMAGPVTVAVACSSSPTTERASSNTSTASPTAASVPVYRLEIGEKPSTLQVYVDNTPTLSEAHQIVADLQSQYTGDADGYFVTISCSEGGTRDVDNRLAKGKFAVGNIGAARTGLDEGGREVSLVEGSKCPPDQLPTGAPSAVSAQRVVDAIIAAGLPAADPRDNSNGGVCDSVQCVQLITTNDVSVYQFADPDAADKWATGLADSGYRNGLIVMRFNLNGSHPTDPAAIPQYKTILDGLME